MCRVYIPEKISRQALSECRAAMALYRPVSIYIGFDETGFYLELPDDDPFWVEIAKCFFPDKM